MKKYIMIMAFLLFFAGSVTAEESEIHPDETVNSTISDEKDSNSTATKFVQLNLIDLAAEKAALLNGSINLTQVAAGEKSSVNLVVAPPGSTLKLHYHQFRDEIVYAIAGQAIFNASGQEYAVKAGDLLYIPSSTQHELLVTGNDTLQLISIFSPPFDGKDRIYL